jgi:hemerythrin-like domain-containing protein
MEGPNLAEDLRRVHAAITRGLDVAIENAARYARGGFHEEGMAAGYRTYVATLLSFLDGHHVSENEIAFPYFEERLPEMPFERLVEEHEAMEEMIERAQVALDDVDEAGRPALGDLEAALRRIRDLWAPHIGTEEAHFEPVRLAEILPPEEHGRLGGLLAQHTVEHGGDEHLVVPFMLYNLPAADRAVMMGAMPPVVTQELMPGPWAEKWAPMKPFLLA